MVMRWFNRVLILTLIGCLAAPVLAQDQPCRLDEARRAFESLRLTETIQELEDCRNRGWPELDTNQKIVALRLLALAYIEDAELDKAEESVRLLMLEDRSYRSPENDPLIYQNWVKELKPKAWYQKRWVQLGGIAVVGVLSFVLLGPQEGPQPLDIPTIGPPPQ